MPQSRRGGKVSIAGRDLAPAACMRTADVSSPVIGRSRGGLEPERHEELHPELDDWRANVGGPVVVDAGPRAPDRLTGIDILCWNIAIGVGRLHDVVAHLRSGMFGGAGLKPERPLVILAQEVYRGAAALPPQPSVHHGGAPAAGRRHDIVEIAEACELSLRYSPSMRNGHHPSDRGNAVLSTVRLGDADAFLLPYVRQRRVVVSATVAGHPDLVFVSAHLDTHGRARRRARRLRFGGGRLIQARALAHALGQLEGSVVLGADLNSVRGVADPAVRALVEAGFHPARRHGSWRHTFHRPVRLLLDHVLYRSTDDRLRRAEVVRLDETPGDRGPAVFGSDHHPLLARFELSPD